ncbi:hypothetical protein [Actinomadura miaoliensis]|uniref:hypothetical protein n=1 Tax=Actinomadura miaoliensis TaxID=430685 RepID=UPI0031ED8B24
MNEVLGLILVVMGVTNATVTPNRIGRRGERFTGHGGGDEETAVLRPIVREAAGAWLLAAELAVVSAGLASLAVEPGAMLIAVVVSACHWRRHWSSPATSWRATRYAAAVPLRKRAPAQVAALGGS